MQNSTAKQIWLVLKPSWISGLFVALLSVFVVIGTLVLSNYQGSRLQQELFEASNSGLRPLNADFQTVTDNLARNQLISNLPLFLFWAALGVVVYLFATSLWGALTAAEELREEMAYVNAPKRHLARTTVLHLVVRLLVLAVWLAYVQLFLKILLPYVLALSHISAVQPASFSSAGYIALALVVIWVSLQAHVVFLRLVFLRSRVWGNGAEA